MSVETLIWLLPVFFMLHDFEELVLFKVWFQKNRAKIFTRSPKHFHRIISKLSSTEESEFALAVAEEFILLSVLSFICARFALYNLFAATVAVFFLHLVVHLIQSAVIGRYVPGLVNGVFASAYSLYAIISLYGRGLIDISSVVAVFPVILIAVAANLFIAHWTGRRLFSFLKRLM